MLISKGKLYFIITICLIALLTFMGQWLIKDSGYIFISYHNTIIETTLWGGLIILLIGFVGLNLIWHFCWYLFKLPLKLSHWRTQQLQHQAQQNTHTGLVRLAEGNWIQAEKLLTETAPFSKYPMLNYLNAATAADALDAIDRRDQYLQQALKISKSPNELAVHLTQAKLQLKQQQLEPCLATLMLLRKQHPKNKYVLELLTQVYLKLKDWPNLLKLIKQVQHQKIYSEDDFKQLQIKAYQQQLKIDLLKTDTTHKIKDQQKTEYQRLKDSWQKTPAALKKEIELIQYYVELLVGLNSEIPKAAIESEKIIQSTLNKIWDEKLILIYGQLEVTDVKPLLVNAKKWLRERPNDTNLLLTLGRLSIRLGEFSAAINYLESSIKLRKSSAAYSQLGEAFANQEQYEQSCQYFQKALAI